MNIRENKLLKILTLVLLGGTIFAWYTVAQDFIRFKNIQGTIFKVSDCLIPNPVTTACFYGAFGFLAAVIWSYKILKFVGERRVAHVKYLLLFTVGCVLIGSINLFFG
jgi:hypothetical protein